MLGVFPMRSLSVTDLQGAVVARARGLVPIYSSDGSCDFTEPDMSSRATLAARAAEVGTQEVVGFGDDLLLVRTNFHAISPPQRLRWELDMRGWFYLHFRLEGKSEEETPEGLYRSYDGECYLMSASHRRSCARRPCGEAWRSVGILCRTSFAISDLQISAENLPLELQRLHA